MIHVFVLQIRNNEKYENYLKEINHQEKMNKNKRLTEVNISNNF